METVLIQTQQQDFHLSKDALKSIPYQDRIINKVIHRIEQEQLTKIKEDTLGILFERLIKEEEKKDLGQFYTPQEIVNYMINFLEIRPESNILDPTCGCGVFLVTAYNYLKQINPNAIQNIYGVDLNNSATKIARINLWLRNGQNLNSLKILEKNIKIGNSPYVTLKNKIDYDVDESFFSEIANGSTNAASLVIVKSYELLKEGGIMAFVLPK